MTQDPVTGEMTPFFSPWKRWSRKVAGIPVVLGGACTLAGVISAVFAIEVFLTRYYDGPFKDVLVSPNQLLLFFFFFTLIGKWSRH